MTFTEYSYQGATVSNDSLDTTYEVPLEPLDDSSSGDVGPTDDSDALDFPSVENDDRDLLDEADRAGSVALPGGID